MPEVDRLTQGRRRVLGAAVLLGEKVAQVVSRVLVARGDRLAVGRLGLFFTPRLLRQQQAQVVWRALVARRDRLAVGRLGFSPWRVYSLTAKGQVALGEDVKAWHNFAQGLSAVLERASVGRMQLELGSPTTQASDESEDTFKRASSDTSGDKASLVEVVLGPQSSDPETTNPT